MIKDTRYIIKRVIIGVLICLILSFIKTCEVHALENFVSPYDLSYRRYLGSNYATTYAKNCTDSTCFFDSVGATTRGVFYTGNGGYTFNNTKIIMFNIGYYDSSNKTDQVANVSINNMPCYYSVSHAQSLLDDGSNDTLYESTSISAYCITNTNVVINGNSPLIEVNYLTNARHSIISLSKIRFVQDDSMNTIISLLQTANGYNLTHENLLIQIRDRLNTIIQNEGSIKSSIDSQSQQQHSDAQAQKKSTDDINNSINNSNVDDPSNDISSMNSKLGTNNVISDLLLLPITLFQNVLNSINGTCSPWNLGSLFGTNLVLPCIDLSSLLGSALYGVIDVLLSGIFVLSIRKRFVDIFQNITSLKDGGNEIE